MVTKIAGKESSFIRLLAAAWALLVSPAAIASPCPPSNVVVDPADVVWTNYGDHAAATIEMSAKTFVIGGETLTTRAYGQAGSDPTIPAPTMRLAPGQKYVVRFHNNLPYEAPNPQHNTFKDPNISNLHTHGLHISGEAPGDDVTRSFEGGFGGDFVYDIPANHMGGTYWYHAHHHGSTYLQVAGGAFGAIIVDDSNDGMPSHVAAMTERQVLFAFLDTTAAGTGGDTLMSGTLSPTWTVNGLVQGNICMPQNEWQHFRVLTAHPRPMERALAFGGNCEVVLLARDGVWRTVVPGAVSNNDLELTGASRADFAVRCSGDADVTIDGTLVATIYADGQGQTTVGPYLTSGPTGSGQWSSVRPAYLRDLRNEPSVHIESISMGARTINGSKWDSAVPTFSLLPDAVQEWGITGARNHPFHLHVYHVQAQNCSGDFEDGEYYDVIASKCDVRFDLNTSTTDAYAGRTVMHCHVLEHEDQGAMGWLEVLPTTQTVDPPTFPSSYGYSEYYGLGGGSFCGDLTCDPTENFCNCSADCGMPPSAELNCTDSVDDDCDGFTDCADADCGTDPVCQPVCGDSTCDPSEDACTCPADCGAPPSTELTCGDGTDNDCDGDIDCADADCATDPICICDNDGVCELGEDCNNCSSDCDSVTKGNPSNRYCCGDGTLQSGEGNGDICDGNP